MSKKSPIKKLKIGELNRNNLNKEQNIEIKDNNYVTFGEGGVKRTFV